MLDRYQGLTETVVDDTPSDRQIIRGIVDTLAGVVLAAFPLSIRGKIVAAKGWGPS